MLTIAYAVNLLFNILEWAILIDVVLSWVYRGRGNRYIDLLHSVTEPLLAPARRLQERFSSNLMIDFSPIITYFVLQIIQRTLLSLLLV